MLLASSLEEPGEVEAEDDGEDTALKNGVVKDGEADALFITSIVKALMRSLTNLL